MATTSCLLIKFRNRDTQSGVTRSTLKAMATHFTLSTVRPLCAGMAPGAEISFPRR